MECTTFGALDLVCKCTTFGALDLVCKCTTFGALDSLIAPVTATETAPIDVMTLLLGNTFATRILAVLAECPTPTLC